MKRVYPALLLLLLGLSRTSNAQPVIGGSHICTRASIDGPYGYAIRGMVIQSDSSFFPFADSGHLTSDGNGHLTGSSTVSQAGIVQARTLTGTYTVNSDCTGAAQLHDSLGISANINLVIIDNGREINFIEANSGVAISGSAKQQQTNCTAEDISGSYGFAISGWTYDPDGTGWGFADSGSLISDGAGGLSLKDTFSQRGTVATRSVSGRYSVNTDCTGNATFTNSAGSIHVNLTVVAGGREIQFVQTDANSTISGSAQRLFALPSDAIVSAGSFSGSAVVPGSIVSIFGSGLATGTAQAHSLPLPSELGGATVKVNGHPAPLFYVNPGQINAQMPVEVSAGPAQLTVSVGGSSSQPVPFTVAKTGPAIFSYGENHAIVVNPNGKVNSPTEPSHVGDTVVAYLTGGGPVHASGAWISGSPSPAGLSRASLPASITVGNQAAQVSYIGLTPGSVGLYQANFKIPKVAAGNHLIVVSVGGQDSNASYISVAE